MRLSKIAFTAGIAVLGFMLFAVAPKARAADLGPPSRSCAVRVCTPMQPTPICISDQPTCPYAPPVCYYEGEEPYGLKHLSCHDERPAPDPGTNQGVCVQTEEGNVLCVGGDKQADEGYDYVCPWVNWAVSHTSEVVMDVVDCDFGRPPPSGANGG